MKKNILFYFLILSQFAMAQTFNWAKNFVTNDEVNSTDMASDTNGNLYIVGNFKGIVDFDPGPGTAFLDELAADKGDIFCIKVNASGSLVWARQIGGVNGFSTVDPSYFEPKIAVDSANNIYVSGLYEPIVDFDPGAGVYQIPPPDSSSPTWQFIAKYNSSGSFIWGENMGDEINVTIQQIKTDSSNNIYLLGGVRGATDIDPTSGVYTIGTGAGNSFRDVYLLKLTSAGNFSWCKQMGNIAVEDYPHDLAVDANDNIVITGYFKGTADFDPSTTAEYNLVSNNNSEDAFVAKYTSDGNFSWAKSFGTPNGYDYGKAITCDASGNIYVSGIFSGTADFDPSPTTVFNLTPIGYRSIYVLKLDGNGNFNFVKTIGATDGTYNYSENVFDIAADDTGNIYFTGNYLAQMDCDPDAGVYTILANGGNDEIYLTSLSSATGAFRWAKTIGGTKYDYGKRIIVNQSTNKLTLMGTFMMNNVDFNPPNNYLLSSSSLTIPNAFLVNYTYSNLGIENYDADDKIVIFPSPAENQVFLESKLAINKIEIYGILGNLIKLKVDNTNSISVSDLSSGIYLVKATTADNKIFVNKFVKQ